jgi:hypothetical protein
MDPKSIFLPVCALVQLTLLVLGLIPFRRFRAAFRGQVKEEDFRYGESANVPQEVSIPNRNMMNLLEVPVLFYVGSIVAFLSARVHAPFLWLSWAYVVLRAVHSFIHVTYNKTMHRLVPFAASNLVLIAFWLRLTVKLLS